MSAKLTELVNVNPRVADFPRRFYDSSKHSVSGAEAFQRYQQVSASLTADEFAAVALAAFTDMATEDRRTFANLLIKLGANWGLTPDSDDPERLASALNEIERQRDSGLASLLFDSFQNRSFSDLLNDPVVKAVLGGIAAVAVHRMKGTLSE